MKLNFLAAALLALATTGLFADENEWFVPLGPPPKAAPRFISGGESFPPLPLPATPLRRSERKRQPSPPQLIGKVVWGESAEFTWKDSGHKTSIADWNLCPADLQSLLNKVNNRLGVRYGYETVNLGSFHADPAKTAMLFFSGGRSIRFSDAQLEMLRGYVMRGGMIVADPPAGSPYFYESFKQAMQKAFPELKFRAIPTDHPVYHMLTDVERIRLPKKADVNAPALEAMYVGCRAAVLLSKYGLGVGWDNRDDIPLIQKAVYYDTRSANQLGLNIVAYAMGYANTGQQEAKPELFGSIDEKGPTDEWTVAQIRHDGAWNVHPGGVAALLRRMRQDSALRVSLKRVPVTPGKDDLSGFAFLYMSGLDDFHFSDSAAAALKDFLNANGTLLINNGLGLHAFDQAVRGELQKILPGAKLEPVPLSHPIYRSLFKIDSARVTPAAVARNANLTAPQLEGISIRGDLRVIYSRFDLEAGWEGEDHPLALGYEPQSAMQIGMNILMYSATH